MDTKDRMSEIAMERAELQIQIDAGRSLPVMEAFYTLQGEGNFQGRAAYFIRLGGCDVGCVWCDVKESWDAELHPVKTVEQIVEEAIQEILSDIKAAATASGAESMEALGDAAGADMIRGSIVVVTGGEPLMYELGPLTKALHAAGFRVHIETSGAYPLSGEIDWVCVSPKKFKAPLPEVLSRAQELKVVVFNKSDFLWAEQHAAQVSLDCKLYLQPEWSKEKQMLPLMIDYVKAHPLAKWSLCVQVHKYINVP